MAAEELIVPEKLPVGNRPYRGNPFTIGGSGRGSACRCLIRYAVLCMGLWLAQQTVLAADNQQREIEAVEVVGERSQVALARSIREAEVRLYELFNELNSTDDYDVTCRFVQVTGSRVPDWRCEIGFMARAGYRNNQEFLQSCFILVSDESSGPNTNGLQHACILPKTDGQMYWENRDELTAMNAEMLALAKDNPELAQAMLDLYAKRQRMQELQLRQRENTGGFFRRLFGGKE